MKQKTFWKKSEENPFDVPNSIRRKVTESANLSDRFGKPDAVEYLWIHMASKPGATASCKCLAEQEWLNIVDEAASAGARWLVIYVGDHLPADSPAWALSQWAQDTHEMCVAFHFTGEALNAEQVSAINRLETDRTFLFVRDESIDAISASPGLEIQVVSAAVPDDVRGSHCTDPANITCVQSDGTLYCCGLVIDEEAYKLGDAQERRIADVARDQSLPHAIEQADQYPEHGCEGCPSHLSKIVLANLPPRTKD